VPNDPIEPLQIPAKTGSTRVRIQEFGLKLVRAYRLRAARNTFVIVAVTLSLVALFVFVLPSLHQPWANAVEYLVVGMLSAWSDMASWFRAIRTIPGASTARPPRPSTSS
jgi:hypothetical protein